MIKSLLTEYGIRWAFNRSVYSAKLKMMNAIPITEKLFEKNVHVKRIDIFNLKVERIEKFLNELPEEKKTKILSIANNAIEGKILGFSSIGLNYGDPINWHYSPITNEIEDSNLKWFQIPDFDPLRGDIKVIWEASRFTHLYYFVRAYMITKDVKYFKAFSNQLNSWLIENQYSYGANYKCGQEATLRMINILMAYSAFKAYKLTTKKDEKNVMKIVEGSYKKVLSNFFYAHKCIKNNHTLTEITGLIIGSWACKDNKRLKKAFRLLDSEIKKQFKPDGGYIQYSFNYQRFALQIIESVMKISRRTNLCISEESRRLIIKSAYLLYQVQDDTGDVPNYGSNDGALIFPVTSCGYRDFRPVVNTIFSLLEGRRVYEPGDYDEEILWFGDKSLNDIPVSLIKKTSSSFEEAGFYTLRHNGGFLMTVLQEFKTRPAQMDQLHIDLWHKGINVLCDTGTYSYATDIGKRMSLTSAHNTSKVEGKEQMKKHGPFFIYNWTKRDNVFHSSDSFNGTMISKNGYCHTRRIEKTDNGYLINDCVIGEGRYCEFYFHTPCKVKIVSTGFDLYDGDQIICKIITDGTIEVKKDFRSLYYLNKEEINCVSIKVDMFENKCSMKFIIELTGR